MKLMLALAATVLIVLVAAAIRRPHSAAPAPLAEPTRSRPSEALRVLSRPDAPALPAETSRPDAEPAPGPPTREEILARLRQAILDGDLNAIAELRIALLAALTPPPVPDDRNGALVYQKAFDALMPMSGELQEALNALKERKATPEQFAALEAYVAANATALTLLKQAASFEQCRFPLELGDGFNTLMPHAPLLMKAAKLLDVELAVRRARELEVGETWNALGKLADSVKEEPILVSQLIRCSILELGGATDPAGLRPILRDVMYAELTAAIHYGQTELTWGSLALPELRAMASYYFEFVVDAAELLPRPFHKVQGRLDDFMRERVENPAPEAQGVRMLAPSLRRILERVARAEALCGAQVDPFTGRAFLERDGVRYSPGPDLVDDGGDPAKDVVIKPRPAK